jgi:nonsense-mediated mRNA decay protein 3
MFFTNISNIKESSKNYGMKDGRQLYRMTYLLRFPPYKKGEFIYFDSNYFLICSVIGNKVHIVNLSNWDEQVVENKDLHHVKIFGEMSLIKEMILISQTNTEIQLMDTTTYKTYDIKKPKPTFFSSKIVQVVLLQGIIFLVPNT